MKSLQRKKIISGILAAALMVLSPAQALAATIEVSPHTGTISVNKPTTISVVVKDSADQFNAAQANVTISNNVTVSDLIMGDCDFSFIKSPSTQNPSFVGVSLGTQKRNCTVYALTLVPTGSDPVTVSITNGSVKREGDAKELLTGVRNGDYEIGSGNIGTMISNYVSNTLAADNIVPVTNAAATIETEANLASYTVSVKVLDEDKKPIRDGFVTLEPQLQATDAAIQEVRTNSEGVAEFKNVKSNVYTVKAKHNGEVLAEQIMNAQGSKQVLTMGIQDEKPVTNTWLPFVIAGSIMVVIAGLFLRNRLQILARR